MRINFDYYVPYDATSWWSFQAQADQIDFVAPQWVTIDACGNIGSRDDRTLVAFARSKGVRIIPTLLTSSSWLNHQILANPAAQDRAVNQIVAYVVEEGYDGFDLDLENVPAGDRAAFTSFVGQLSGALHAKGKLFTMALPSKRSDVTTGLAGAFDYAALAPHLDLAIIMTYGFSWSTSPPGSTAPQDWVDAVIAYTTSAIPAEKVLLGVPFYGYDWNLSQGGPARALTYPQAVMLAQAYGATIVNDSVSQSATFTYTAPAGQPTPAVTPPGKFNHEIIERPLPSCGVKPPPSPPGPTPTPAPTIAPGTPLKHEVWIENASSVAARLGLADKHGTGGVAVWRLGQEDPAVWSILANWRQGIRTPTPN